MNEVLDTTLSEYNYAGLELALYGGSGADLIQGNWESARSLADYNIFVTNIPTEKKILFMTIEQLQLERSSQSAADFVRTAIESFHYAKMKEIRRSLVINSATLNLKVLNLNFEPFPGTNKTARIDQFAIEHEASLVSAADMLADPFA